MFVSDSLAPSFTEFQMGGGDADESMLLGWLNKCEFLFDLLVNVFVFLNYDNSRIKDLNRRIWARTTKAAGLDGLRFHDLRHNWASRHAESGTDLLAIKELGGWKTLEMVQRYTHPSLSYLSQQANNIVKEKNEKEVTLHI